jgi:hypothetical protein
MKRDMGSFLRKETGEARSILWRVRARTSNQKSEEVMLFTVAHHAMRTLPLVGL